MCSGYNGGNVTVNNISAVHINTFNNNQSIFGNKALVFCWE